MTAPLRAVSQSRRFRICIVTNAPISQNPRVVKEADALSAEGHNVVVVFAQHAQWTRADDQRILDQSHWRGVAIRSWPGGVIPRMIGITVRLRAALFRTLSRFWQGVPVPELAFSRFLIEQLYKAVSTRADLYIGHNPSSLPVVAWAARLRRAKYGFDFEDFHAGEKPSDAAPGLPDKLLAVVERRYLPGASYLTAASPGIAEEVRRSCGVTKPMTVLNVFPWQDRGRLPERKPRAPSEPLSMYWVSQIVGLNRGLQDSIRALGLVHSTAALHIRGAATPEVKQELLAIAREAGAEGRIFFHEPVSSEQVLESCAEHDVGLCLETPTTLNRDICITNKLFLYMLAGLAVIASRTKGQSEILSETPAAGFLYDSGDIEELASIIERLASDTDLLLRARGQALEAARTRWNWEAESRVLVHAVDRAMPADGGAPIASQKSRD